MGALAGVAELEDHSRSVFNSLLGSIATTTGRNLRQIPSIGWVIWKELPRDNVIRLDTEPSAIGAG